MKIIVNAKINSSLAVLGVSGGYHMLHSTVESIGLSDIIMLTKREDNEVTINEINGIEAIKNTAYRVACRLVELGMKGVDIVIEKGIPLAGGLGGSSADSAGVIAGMCHLNGVELFSQKVLEVASQFGSDITYMLRGGSAVLGGKGDDVTLMPYELKHYVVTIFETEVNTAEVFALLDNGSYNFNGYSNYLQAVVECHFDYMRDYLKQCHENNLSPTMSGSGSSYFVEVNDDKQAEKLASLLCGKGYSSIATTNLPKGITFEL